MAPRGPSREERWLCAGLCLARLGDAGPEPLAESLPWLLALQAELPALPPPGVVVDLGRLALGASLRPERPVPTPEPRLRAAVRAYEDHLLSRLAAEPRLGAVVNALARLPGELRPRGVAFLTARVLARLGFAAGLALNPGLLRRVLERPPSELLQAGHAALREPDAREEPWAEAYEALASAARRARTLLGDAEVFTLENLERLQGRAQRLALEQAVEAAEALVQALPARARPRTASSAPVLLEDEEAFPQGGFASVSNVGSLENLVTSELVYMEDGVEDGAPVDLFDMRYVEGELLYYTRDESLAVRRRRRVTLVLLPGLLAAHVKDPGLRWQRGVLVLGLVLGLVRRLSVWLGDQELRWRVVVASGGLEAERGLCELLLREWLARGILEVTAAPESDGLAPVLSQAAEDAKRARVDVLLLGGEQVPIPPSGVGLVLLDVTHPVPRLVPSVSHPAAPGGGGSEEPWEAWRGVTLELARRLL